MERLERACGVFYQNVEGGSYYRQCYFPHGIWCRCMINFMLCACMLICEQVAWTFSVGGQGAVVWWMVNRNFHLFRWMCSSVPMCNDGKAHFSWWGHSDRRAFRITWHYFQSPQSLSFIFNAWNVVSMRRVRGLKSFLTFKEFGQMTRQRTLPQRALKLWGTG